MRLKLPEKKFTGYKFAWLPVITQFGTIVWLENVHYRLVRRRLVFSRYDYMV